MENKTKEPKKKSRPICKAKTTQGLSKGQRVLVQLGEDIVNVTITCIFDRWTIGTPIGSFWAENIVETKDLLNQ